MRRRNFTVSPSRGWHPTVWRELLQPRSVSDEFPVSLTPLGDHLRPRDTCINGHLPRERRPNDRRPRRARAALRNTIRSGTAMTQPGTTTRRVDAFPALGPSEPTEMQQAKSSVWTTRRE